MFDFDVYRRVPKVLDFDDYVVKMFNPNWWQDDPFKDLKPVEKAECSFCWIEVEKSTLVDSYAGRKICPECRKRMEGKK